VSDVDRYDEEVRLALVLNGGVSLAIWMGGVTCELDRARRAAFPELRKLEGVGVWAEVCAAMRTRVVVDIVAGTSAGGLNGAVMAAAIARRAAMPNLRERWKRLGDFKNLLITEDASDELSVLSGAFFADSISEVFTDL
jgi:predicted acylesterase/phospholipase RssA